MKMAVVLRGLCYFISKQIDWYTISRLSYFPRRDLREAGRGSENRTLTDSTEERC